MRRRPRGYVGTRHETIGSDIMAIEQTLLHLMGRGATDPRSHLSRVLGEEAIGRFETITKDAWYPIEWMLSMLETLDTRLGTNGLRRVGRTLFALSHEAQLKEHASCGRDVIHGFDGMYRNANRGQKIGGWEVLEMDDMSAELEKTTPHHCALEEGIMSAALACVGAPSVIGQRRCMRDGADSCVFVVRPVAMEVRWLR